MKQDIDADTIVEEGNNIKCHSYFHASKFHHQRHHDYHHRHRFPDQVKSSQFRPNICFESQRDLRSCVMRFV